MENFEIIKVKKSESISEVTNTMENILEYIKFPDGHDYIVSNLFSKGQSTYNSGAAASTSIIHAIGCRQCKLEKEGNII